jgi:hypothetical protein
VRHCILAQPLWIQREALGTIESNQKPCAVLATPATFQACNRDSATVMAATSMVTEVRQRAVARFEIRASHADRKV